jgi:hypothetical protein
VRLCPGRPAIFTLAGASGCKPSIKSAVIAPPAADEVTDALEKVKGPKRSISMIKDVRRLGAETLGRAGSAAPPDAIPALEKRSLATNADDDTKQAARDAIAKIKGS